MGGPSPDFGNDQSSNSARGRARTVVGLITASAVAGGLTLLVATESTLLNGFDQAITDFTRTWADSLGWPVDLANEISKKTGVVFSSFIAGLFALFLLARRRWAAAAFLMLSAFLGGLIGGFMKFVVSRDRPPAAAQFEEDMTDSFPSGHTMVGIYLYLATGLLLLRMGQANNRAWMTGLGWALIVFGPLLGLTRLIVGAHWPTDVIGGWAFGSAVVCMCALAFWSPLDAGWLTWRKRREQLPAASD